jgi:hypothetical protein
MGQVSRRHSEVIRSFLQCLGGFRGSRWSREFFVLASVTRNVLDAARYTIAWPPMLFFPQCRAEKYAG